MYTHSHPYTTLLSHLSAHLPHSGPLYRRIQYQVSHSSPTAHVFASFPEFETPQSASGSGPQGQEQGPWLAAYADIHRGPDTQIWLFSSLESSANSETESSQLPSESNGASDGSASARLHPRAREITKNHLLSLFTYIQSTLVPAYLSSLSTTPTPVSTISATVDEGVPKIPAHAPTSYLLGTVHTLLESLIVELREQGKLTIHRGAGVHYVKYCFPNEAFSAEPTPSPLKEEQSTGAGYRFHDSAGTSGIQGHHIDLVKNRTNIPRSREALLAMGGVALYHGDGPSASIGKQGSGEMPIAWAFLGFDGSLSSLHVEPEHRGRGLAALVGREVMKRGVEVFEPENSCSGPRGTSEEWYYADVAVDNAASRRVMEKMGGVARWRVAWMVVEVQN
ncbi:hypothetical protein BJX64DRAFT_107959 [Aspergillus heterothallicus]